jgi:hypothetical protein
VKDIILFTINAKWIHPSLALRLLKANLGDLEPRSQILEFALRQPLEEKLAPFLAVRDRGQSSAAPKILGISVSIWNHLATIEFLQALEKIGGNQTSKPCADSACMTSPLCASPLRETPFCVSLSRETSPCAVAHFCASPCKSAQMEDKPERPLIVLGGPEVSHLPEEAEIFRYADYVIRGEGEIAFRELCEKTLCNPPIPAAPYTRRTQFINAEPVNLNEIKDGYSLYTDEDIAKKLIYVEASRGCPFNCEFCLSAVKPSGGKNETEPVREFPLEQFLASMDELIRRGARTIKFLDRSFNANTGRAVRIMEFFIERLETLRDERENFTTPDIKREIPASPQREPFVVHFEIVPFNLPDVMRNVLSRFPAGTLRLEAGIQTLNPSVASRVKRAGVAEAELEVLRFLVEKTGAIIHADLIAGLPGEDLDSFGRVFDRLWEVLSPVHTRAEIQLGILKLLPGAPVSRHIKEFGMRFNNVPPYQLLETSAMPAADIDRLQNFARFWELIVNRGLFSNPENNPAIDCLAGTELSTSAERGRSTGKELYARTERKRSTRTEIDARAEKECSIGTELKTCANTAKNKFTDFMLLSDSLLAHFGRNWGIDKNELIEAVKRFSFIEDSGLRGKEKSWT